jgi:hypothetical protein
MANHMRAARQGQQRQRDARTDANATGDLGFVVLLAGPAELRDARGPASLRGRLREASSRRVPDVSNVAGGYTTRPSGVSAGAMRQERNRQDFVVLGRLAIPLRAVKRQ